MSGRMKTEKEGEELTVVASEPTTKKKKRYKEARVRTCLLPRELPGGEWESRDPDSDRAPRGLFGCFQVPSDAQLNQAAGGALRCAGG